MPSRGMLLLFGGGLLLVAAAWMLLARNPNASDQRAREFGATTATTTPAERPEPVAAPRPPAPASATSSARPAQPGPASSPLADGGALAPRGGRTAAGTAVPH